MNDKGNMKISLLQTHFGSLHCIREDNLSKAPLREFPFKTKDPLFLCAIQTAETQLPRDRGLSKQNQKKARSNDKTWHQPAIRMHIIIS